MNQDLSKVLETKHMLSIFHHLLLVQNLMEQLIMLKNCFSMKLKEFMMHIMVQKLAHFSKTIGHKNICLTQKEMVIQLLLVTK